MLVDENDQPVEHHSLNMWMLWEIEAANEVVGAAADSQWRLQGRPALREQSAELHRHFLLDMIEQLLAELHPEPEVIADHTEQPSA